MDEKRQMTEPSPKPSGKKRKFRDLRCQTELSSGSGEKDASIRLDSNAATPSINQQFSTLNINYNFYYANLPEQLKRHQTSPSLSK